MYLAHHELESVLIIIIITLLHQQYRTKEIIVCQHQHLIYIAVDQHHSTELKSCNAASVKRRIWHEVQDPVQGRSIYQATPFMWSLDLLRFINHAGNVTLSYLNPTPSIADRLMVP